MGGGRQGGDAVSGPYSDLARQAGVPSWLPYQVEAFDEWVQSGRNRACLYYKTGAGKTLTSLAMLRMSLREGAIVVAPPSTHAGWQAAAKRFGLQITTISHAKFRMKDYLLSRSVPLIVDEFHMLGGHTGKGWKKLDQFARQATAEVIICSATPNYNDAERVYCVKHVLEPTKTVGGYLAFLHQHCNTEHNPYGATPNVSEDRPFKMHANAADFLASLDGVYYLKDDLEYQIEDIELSTPIDDAFDRYSFDARRTRIMASGMEQRHQRTFQRLVSETGSIYPHVLDELERVIAASATPVLVYSEHQTIAAAALQSLARQGRSLGFVSGGMSTKAKEAEIERFRKGEIEVLIGTASLATGTDGVDKMCDTLIILDDTDDDAKRRQLVGRIMPRGTGTGLERKRVHRILVS